MKAKKAWFGMFLMVLAVVIIGSTAIAADKKAAPAKAESKADLIDINTATKEQLMTLEGIGDAYSQKIISGRPYARKDQLASKKIIPEPTYNQIKDRIIAKQPPTKGK